MPDNEKPPEPPVTIKLSREEASDKPTLDAALAKVGNDWSRLKIEGTGVVVP